MDKKSILRFALITLSFIVLIFGYGYFNEQSLIASGRDNADIIAQRLEDGDVQAVKSQLADFVGLEEPYGDERYDQALKSLDYVAVQLDDGEELEYVDGELFNEDGYTRFGGVYELASPQGGSDFLLITMRREDDKWVLANTQLAATNPLLNED